MSFCPRSGLARLAIDLAHGRVVLGGRQHCADVGTTVTNAAAANVPRGRGDGQIVQWRRPRPQVVTWKHLPAAPAYAAVRLGEVVVLSECEVTARHDHTPCDVAGLAPLPRLVGCARPASGRAAMIHTEAFLAAPRTRKPQGGVDTERLLAARHQVHLQGAAQAIAEGLLRLGPREEAGRTLELFAALLLDVAIAIGVLALVAHGIPPVVAPAQAVNGVEAAALPVVQALLAAVLLRINALHRVEALAAPAGRYLIRVVAGLAALLVEDTDVGVLHTRGRRHIALEPASLSGARCAYVRHPGTASHEASRPKVLREAHDRLVHPGLIVPEAGPEGSVSRRPRQGGAEACPVEAAHVGAVRIEAAVPRIALDGRAVPRELADGALVRSRRGVHSLFELPLRCLRICDTFTGFAAYGGSVHLLPCAVCALVRVH
mmetsp:Transcript_89559/g.252398  ORF Transcript_89559/g.252398 Transcript_89559/m.252398 type:complete len:432 (-) Transcript_89559:455-1750(-)